MNFTREPIIETVITPREGCKLAIRGTKAASGEEYFVEAVEVVSFGNSIFYRCLERPQSFLLPVSDYEVLELKDTRMVLKNASPERSIKIGGGRDAPVRREPEREEASYADGSRSPSQQQDRGGKRDGKRRRGRRGRDRDRMEQPVSSMPQEGQAQQEPSYEEALPREMERAPEQPREERPIDAPKAPSFISKLFPPPSTLIKDSISRYKTAETTAEEIFPSSAEEPVVFEEKGFMDEMTYGSSEGPKTEDTQDDEEE